jgi:hypothetical protein
MVCLQPVGKTIAKEIWELEEREPTELELRYAKAHKEMTERVARYDERLLTVIKSHLSCEEALNQLLSAASRAWKKKKFSGKLDVGRYFIKPTEMTAPALGGCRKGKPAPQLSCPRPYRKRHYRKNDRTPHGLPRRSLAAAEARYRGNDRRANGWQRLQSLR